MKVLHAIPIVLAATVTLTSAASAGSGAAKQRVMITSQAAKTTHAAPFVLTPLQAGPLKRDSGKEIAGLAPGHSEVRDGQRVEIYDDVATWKGKRGSIVVHYHAEYVDAGNGYHASKGTWKVVRGTGRYAGITGGGRSGNVYLDRGPWSSRAEGFLTLR